MDIICPDQECTLLKVTVCIIFWQLKSLEFFSDIKLRFFGEAYVYFEIGVGGEKQIFYSEEKYFDNTLSVISIGNYVMV